MSESVMTGKQKRFCEEYVIDYNATRAALAAGYSENSAKQIGSENLTKLDIQSYISEIQKDLSKLSGVTALRNILELKKLAYSSLSDLFKDWNEPKDWNELTEEQKACISEIVATTVNFGEEKNKTTIKIKLHSKQQAIEGLNKMLGFNAAEKSEYTLQMANKPDWMEDES